MKPLGPIPAGFEAENGELALGGQAVSALVEQAGETPLFIYSRDMIAQRIADLRRAMPDRRARAVSDRPPGAAPMWNRQARASSRNVVPAPRPCGAGKRSRRLGSSVLPLADAESASGRAV